MIVEHNMKNESSTVLNAKLIAFIKDVNLHQWKGINLEQNLKKFLYSNEFSKNEIIKLFEVLQLPQQDAIFLYIEKCFYMNRARKKVGNFLKFKHSFIIFMQIFDFLFKKDVIDFHYKLNSDSNLIDYYKFIPKVDIFKGWSDFNFIELLVSRFSLGFSYHIKSHKKFFVKLGIYSPEVKDLFIKIINAKNFHISDSDSIAELDFFIKELRYIANISFIHIFEILICKIIFIVDLELCVDSKEPNSKLTVDYYNDDPEFNVIEFNKIAKSYYDDFMEDYNAYREDYNNYLIRFKLKSDNKSISNLLKKKIKETLMSVIFTNEKIQDKYLSEIDHVLSINSPNKEKIYLIYYNFSNKAKLDFFNIIISKYNPRLYKNKIKYLEYLKPGKSIKPTPSKDDKYQDADEDDYFYYDLSLEANQDFINELKESNSKVIDSVEKSLKALKYDCYDETIQFVIFDSFNYLKFFHEHFDKNDLTCEEIVNMFNYKKLLPK